MSEVRCKLMEPPNVSKAVLHRKEREAYHDKSTDCSPHVDQISDVLRLIIEGGNFFWNLLAIMIDMYAGVFAFFFCCEVSDIHDCRAKANAALYAWSQHQYLQ